MSGLIADDESKLCEYFQKRYENLMKLRVTVKDIDWRCVLDEMERTLIEYRNKSRTAVLYCIQNNKEFLLSTKLSLNCLSVASLMFCERFQDLLMEVDISRITEELRENIISVLPYLTSNMIAIRITEIMLYAMCTVREEYVDGNGQWSSLALQCFNHLQASDEIKVASAVLICEWRKDVQLDDIVNIYKYLQCILVGETFYGFKKNSDIQYSITKIMDHLPLDIQMKEKETKRSDFFGKRYAYLLDLYKRRDDIGDDVVIKEMTQTIKLYKEKSEEIILDCVQDNEELSLSGKISLNCISVTSALFCAKFNDRKINKPVDTIGDDAREILRSMLPYLSKNIVAARMVEILLYVMCTVCKEFRECNGKWSELAKQCFSDTSATEEMKLASTVLVCEWNKDGVDGAMFALLKDTMRSGRYLGFGEKEIKYYIATVQHRFAKGFQIQELVTETRDSGYKSDEERDPIKSSQNRYKYLITMHQKMAQLDCKIVVNELRKTLRKYKQNSNLSIVERIKNNQELSVADKVSLNCVSVAAAMFCEKFNGTKIQTNIREITDDLSGIFKSLFPHVSDGYVALRMMEIILYVMCTVSCQSDQCEDLAGEWCIQAKRCFQHRHATQEIQLAASVLLCHLDFDGIFVDKRHVACLKQARTRGRYLGFTAEEINAGLAKVQHLLLEVTEEENDDTKWHVLGSSEPSS